MSKRTSSLPSPHAYDVWAREGARTQLRAIMDAYPDLLAEMIPTRNGHAPDPRGPAAIHAAAAKRQRGRPRTEPTHPPGRPGKRSAAERAAMSKRMQAVWANRTPEENAAVAARMYEGRYGAGHTPGERGRGRPAAPIDAPPPEPVAGTAGTNPPEGE